MEFFQVLTSEVHSGCTKDVPWYGEILFSKFSRHYSRCSWDYPWSMDYPWDVSQGTLGVVQD